MNINKIFKNPLFMGALAFGLTYGFLYWQNKKKAEDLQLETPDPVKMNIPIIVGIIITILTYFLFKDQPIAPPIQNNLPSNNPINPANSFKSFEPVNGFKLVSDSFDSATYRIIGKNAISLPGEDVFIDIGRF